MNGQLEARVSRLENLTGVAPANTANASLSDLLAALSGVQAAVTAAQKYPGVFWNARWCTGLTLTPGVDWNPRFSAASTNVIDFAMASAGGEIQADSNADLSFQQRYSMTVMNSGAASVSVACYFGAGANPGMSRVQVSINGVRTEFTATGFQTLTIPTGTVSVIVMCDSDGDGLHAYMRLVSPASNSWVAP